MDTSLPVLTVDAVCVTIIPVYTLFLASANALWKRVKLGNTITNIVIWRKCGENHMAGIISIQEKYMRMALEASAESAGARRSAHRLRHRPRGKSDRAWL